MTRRTPTKSGRGAVATGATATGAASLAALAMGAAALGALAVGALAVGRLTVGRARLRRVEIGELTVGRLAIGAADPGAPATVCRVRAAPGQGDALERLVLDEIAAAPRASARIGRSAPAPTPTCSCSTRPDPPRPPRPAPRRDRASTPSSGRPPSRACSRPPPTLRSSSSGRSDTSPVIPSAHGPTSDTTARQLALQRIVRSATNPRAPRASAPSRHCAPQMRRGILPRQSARPAARNRRAMIVHLGNSSSARAPADVTPARRNASPGSGYPASCRIDPRSPYDSTSQPPLHRRRPRRHCDQTHDGDADISPNADLARLRARGSRRAYVVRRPRQ